jgi:cytosol aminopeptidase
MPANHLQPANFVEVVSEELRGLGNVEIEVRDRAWMQEKQMGCFLGVAQGCPSTPPYLLEAHYRGAPDPAAPPLVLVGKGVTFDSGGISIKPSAGMGLMKGDMGGAAAVAGVMRGLAALQVPLNVIGLCGLTENMPSGDAIRPGDVLRAMNGTTVEVENTDAEGRLVLADVLCYARKFNARYTVDVATLTGAMDVALGAGAVGVFSDDDELVARMVAAGERSGEPVWRMPLFDLYRERIRSPVADLSNCGPRGAGACTAASFLRHFADTEQWMHMDIGRHAVIE